MKEYAQIYILSIMLVFCTSCNGQNNTDLVKNNIKSEKKNLEASRGPNSITRTIKQDRNGNIWIASFEGIIRYDGKSFTNITSKISSCRFFSVLEDTRGNFWFASIGSGVYYYDGKSFQNFTTKEGLANNNVTCIFEDRTGNIWFGTGGGVSRYNGKSFRNFTTNDGLNYVNTIIEDRTGKIWFGTRDGACFYDGEKFTTFTINYNTPFENVRSIIEDKNGNIWLGGEDGLWRYDGSTYDHFTKKFVGYIYQDRSGNIWTSSVSANSQDWALSRYDNTSLSNKLLMLNPKGTEIKSDEKMIFGILEDYAGNIWFGTLDGVQRYDGNTFEEFND